MKRTSLLLLTLIGVSCQRAQTPAVPGDGLVGSWQYVERGYSPGAGYIVEPIPRNPMQRVDFLPDNTIRLVNVGDQLFATARTYRLDSTQRGKQLSLFNGENAIVGFPMAMSIRNDTLRLSPPCIEGCHLAFIRLR